MQKGFKLFPLLRGLIKKENNAIYLDSQNEIGTRLYVERKYITWEKDELALIEDKVLTAKRKKRGVNLSVIQEFLPYRTISSIRCKVREYMHRAQYNAFTYTQPD